jgi:uncharacterized phage-associated protein
MTTADAVADYLIALAHQRGESVNNLKLQKLLYYAQAWHLALRDEPLFREKFQAWIYGPAVPCVYRRFEPFGWRDIPAPETAPPFTGETREFLDELAAEYMPLDEFTLEDLARREVPWLNARGGLPPEEPCSTEISEVEMRNSIRHVAEAA